MRNSADTSVEEAKRFIGKVISGSPEKIPEELAVDIFWILDDYTPDYIMEMIDKSPID